MTRNTIVLSSLLLLVGSVPAFAQDGSSSDKTNGTTATSASSDQPDMPARPKTPRAPAVFLTAGYGIGRDESSHFVTSSPGGAQTNLSGTSRLRSFGIGTFLTPRLSVRFETALPTTLSVNSTSSGAPVIESLRVAQTTRTGDLLFGYHTSSARPVSVEYLGGVLFMSQKQDSVSQVLTAGGTPLAAPSESASYAYKSAAIAGADVNVALGRYLAVVPEFRVWSMSGTFSSRASLAFRLNF
jgi:hypothetical protein